MQLKKNIRFDLAEPGNFDPIGEAVVSFHVPVDMVQQPEKSGSPVCTAGRSRHRMAQEVIL